MRHSAADRVHSHVVTCLLIAASLCCCTTRPKVASDPALEPRPRRFERPSLSPARGVDAEIARVAQQIADVRGWEPRLSVRVEAVDQERMIHSMLADVHSQIAPNVLRAQQDFLAAFGWAPTGFDFERDVISRFARELSGVYCVTCREILLAGDIEGSSARRTLRHELVHAFQDARYDLGARTRWASDRGDYIAAIHALAEGEATCIELQIDDPRHRGCLDPAFDDSQFRDGDSDPSLLSVPRVVRHSLYAPYVDGVRYVRRLLLKGGWAAVERAWGGMLQSTRGLLRDTEQEAARLPVTPPSTGQCTLRFVDMIGEESLRGFVGEMAAPRELISVLESLDGERAAAWQCDVHCVTTIRLHFGDAAAAAIFARWLGDSLRLNAPGGAVPCMQFGGRAVSLQKHGQDIAVASVHSCHGQRDQDTADNCPRAGEIANRLADLHWQ